MRRNIGRKIKLYKIIIAILLVIAFTVSVTSCKEIVEEQQQEEEKPAVEVSNETKEETKETPPVVEEIPAPIEYEGVIIPKIEGLRFEEGTFYAEAGNPYGLEEGEKVGVFVKDAVEINGVMESSIGLRPEVIEVIQKEIMEEEKRFVYPFPIDLEKAKADLGQDQVVKIKEVADTQFNEWRKEDGTFWENNTYLAISNVPVETVIFSPLSAKANEYFFVKNYFDIRDDYYVFSFRLVPLLKEKFFRDTNRIDLSVVEIGAVGIKLLPEGIEEKMNYEGPLPFYSSDVDIKLGTPVAEVISEEYLDNKYWDWDGIKEDPPDSSIEPSIRLDCTFIQVEDPNKPIDSNAVIRKELLIGLEALLKLGKENIPVFILPVHE